MSATPETSHKHKLSTPEAKQDKDKIVRMETSAVFELEDYPGVPPPVLPPPVAPQQPSQSQQLKAPPIPCLCGGSMTKTVKIKCATCSRVWHGDCVGLKGGSEYLQNKLESNGWNCPKCFVFPENILELFKADDITIEPNELEKVGILINKEINLVIPKVVAGVEEKIKEGCFDQVFKDAGRTVSASWADIARGDQNAIIKEAVQATTDVALQQSMKVLDSNLTERKKRARNIVIQNIPDNSPGASLAEVICNHLGEGLRTEHILSCNRLGKIKERPIRPRTIHCVMLREDDAVWLTNDGKGRKFPGGVWANPDLTRTERDVLFKRREERKRLRNGNRTTSTEPPLIDLHPDEGDRNVIVSEEQTMVGQINVSRNPQYG